MVNIGMNVAHNVAAVLHVFPFSAVKTVQTFSPADRSVAFINALCGK